MSEEPKENSKEPAAKAAEVSASVNPAVPVESEAAPFPAGEMGQLLENSKIAVKHLGNDPYGVEMIDLACADLLRAAEVIRDQGHFDMLLSCTGVDWKDRLESVYHLYSTKTAKTLAIKVTAENEHSPSLMPIWHAADWHERESYDLLGIQYDGHANLTRILMPNDWLGHPLRKNYKVDDPRLVWNER
jgi:NADH-quinone oxidoreductase subunit C